MNNLVFTVSVILQVHPHEIGKRYSLSSLIRVYSGVVKTYQELNIGSGLMSGLMGISPTNSSSDEGFRDITDDMDGDEVAAYYMSRKQDLTSLADLIPPGINLSGGNNGK